MKPTIFKSLSIIAFFVLFTVSCAQDEFDLNQSVFIEDETHPGLPIYSEWGYNTFGMYIDRSPFVSYNYEIPAKIIVNPDTFNLYLNGEYNGASASLHIAMIGYAPNDYSKLISLNDSTVNLKSDRCIVKLRKMNNEETLQILEGNITFKKVQNLYIDNEFAKTILSGTINFKTFINKQPVAISYGRFDVGIGYDSFYYY